MDDERICDITAHLHHKTAKAALVSLDDNDDNAVWVPFSQIEIEYKDGNVVELQVPEWLAVDKGLV